MVVPSGTESTTYAWLGAFPNIREWIGDRIINNLSLSSYTLANKKFEVTISVPRTKIEDDQYGIFGPILEKMGADVTRHPDDLVFGLLREGFSTPCFDGQYFFDADHPVGGNGGGPISSVSNVQAGSSTPWFLIDAGQPLKALIYQERTPFQFQSLTRDEDEHVFFNDAYVYGVRGRSNVGFGLWQLAYASKAELTPANYELARQAMMEQKGDNGKTLGITPHASRCSACAGRFRAPHSQGPERGWRDERMGGQRQADRLPLSGLTAGAAMTGTGTSYGLSADDIRTAFAGAVDLHEDGSITLQLSAPVSVDGEMTIRGRKALTFDRLVFHPLPNRMKPSAGDAVISALAASLLLAPKVAKRITHVVTDEDFRRIRALLGHVLMVRAKSADPHERAEVLALHSPAA